MHGLGRGLDILGWVPGPIGIAANVGSAGISFGKGDFLSGGLILAGALAPGGGSIGKLSARAIGKIGEEALAKAVGGVSNKFFRTSLGARFVDQFASNIGNEAKVGYQSLTKSLQNQIAKDLELKAGEDVRGVVWHFYPSPVTGKVGPSGPLRDALEKAFGSGAIKTP